MHTLLWATSAYAASLAGSTVAEKDAVAVEEVPCSEASRGNTHVRQNSA